MNQRLIIEKQKVRRRSRLPIFVVMIFVMFFTLAFLRNGVVNDSEATTGFNAGHIISDYVMGNYNSMTVDEIQAFLDSKNSCNVPLSALSGGYLDGETYSITYASGRTYKWHVKDGMFVCMAKEKFGDNGAIGEGKTAAQLIYDYAQEYRINPQVILVILEKEQSLLSDGYPNNFDYGWALGFGAYDYGEWNTKYAGFKEQLRAAFDFYSWFLYEYDEDEAWWSYDPEQSEIYVRLGQSNILYNPDWECGYSSVNVENRATVALYVYTPYQPNEAALAAGSGTGDYCSSYGNRNFYNYFTKWFGNIRDEGVVFEADDYSGTYTIYYYGDKNKTISIGLDNNVEALVKEDKTQWQIEKIEDYYIITNKATGKALDVSGGVFGNKVNVWQYNVNKTCAQRWNFVKNNDNTFTIHSACYPQYVLDLADSNTNIQVYKKTDYENEHQKWEMKKQ